ncbi:MAG: ABC transporter ATP-binding protein [Planctomycetota bacterium]|jgi:ABC-2 type transport system ATP-binding protein
MGTTLNIEEATKSYGEVRALQGVGFEVKAGEVVALLGPNGAGKSTLIRSITTLEQLDSGIIQVKGVSTSEDPRTVRRFLGYAGQESALDKVLTAREFLRFQGGLVHLPKAEIRPRSQELLQRFGLADAADRPIEGYSGGMKRRLDLAASVMHRPKLLILDEPSTGLDYDARRGLWQLLSELRAEGTSLLLATHDFEEADVLSDRAVMMSLGEVVGVGTPDELRAGLGSWILSAMRREHRAEGDREFLRELFAGVPGREMPPAPQSSEYAKAISPGQEDKDGRPWSEWLRQHAEAQGVELVSVGVRRPTLQDAYLAATQEPASSPEVTV